MSLPASLHQALRQSSPSVAVEAFRLLHAPSLAPLALALPLQRCIFPRLSSRTSFDVHQNKALSFECHRLRVPSTHLHQVFRSSDPSVAPPDLCSLTRFCSPLSVRATAAPSLVFPHRPSGYRTNRGFSSALTWPLPYKENATMQLRDHPWSYDGTMKSCKGRFRFRPPNGYQSRSKW